MEATTGTGRRVIVIGDMMLDIDLDAEPRGNAENAGACYTGECFRYLPGGAANVVRIIREIGKVEELGACGHVGPDWAGEILQDWVEGICDNEDLTRMVTTEQPTTVKLRVHHGGKIVARIDREQKRFDGYCAVPHSAGLKLDDVLVLADYGKGVFGDEAMRTLKACVKAGMTTVVNPSPVNDVDWSGATVCVLNQVEHDLIGFTGAKWTLVTKGPMGGQLFFRQRLADDYRVEPVERPQVVGAGDSVTGMLASCLAAGSSVPDAARQAVRFAAEYVKQSRWRDCDEESA